MPQPNNTEEAQVEQFYEDLQDLVELTSKKDVLFPTQGSNPGLPHCRRILYCPSHQGTVDTLLIIHLRNETIAGFLIHLSTLKHNGFVNLIRDIKESQEKNGYILFSCSRISPKLSETMSLKCLIPPILCPEQKCLCIT